MDRPDADGDAFRRALRDLAWSHRLLGGRRALRRGLARLLPSLPGRLRLLDVGAGEGALTLDTLHWARRRGLDAWACALDRDPRCLSLARRRIRPEMAVAAGDALRLPFRDGAFDVAVASLVLHHVPDGKVPEVLAEMRRVARVGVVVNDLLRHPTARLLIAVLGRVTFRSPMFRHDAPLSVLRGFTPEELAEHARRAGLRVLALERRRFYRVVLVAGGCGGAPAPGDRLDTIEPATPCVTT